MKRSVARSPRARFIPKPTDTDIDLARLQHRDIAELDAAARWAERHVLTLRLALLIFRRQPERMVHVWPGELPIWERAWLTERIARLRAAEGPQ